MVGHAFLLTASLLTGQSGDYQVISAPQQNCNCNKGSTGPVQPVARNQPRPPLFNSGGNRPILSKIGSLFGGKQNQESGTEVTPDYYRRMPTTTGVPVGIVTTEPPLFDKTIQPAGVRSDNLKPISVQGNETLLPAKKFSPLLPQFANKVGHEDDFTWITGQLQQENGQWVIYYASPDTIDRFGGSIIMQAQGELRGAQNGDLVSVQGSVAQGPGGRSIYRATGINLIERGQK